MNEYILYFINGAEIEVSKFVGETLLKRNKERSGTTSTIYDTLFQNFPDTNETYDLTKIQAIKRIVD